MIIGWHNKHNGLGKETRRLSGDRAVAAQQQDPRSLDARALPRREQATLRMLPHLVFILHPHAAMRIDPEIEEQVRVRYFSLLQAHVLDDVEAVGDQSSRGIEHPVQDVRPPTPKETERAGATVEREATGTPLLFVIEAEDGEVRPAEHEPAGESLHTAVKMALDLPHSH